jgi:hypothetical protein
MYTLRRILKDGYEYNFFLGKNYTLIRKDSVSEEEWNEVSSHYWGPSYNKHRTAEDKTVDNVPEISCFAFVVSENGSDYHFILPWQQNYIMTSDGKTFSNIKP